LLHPPRFDQREGRVLFWLAASRPEPIAARVPAFPFLHLLTP
jgi:hypothetical protein